MEPAPAHSPSQFLFPEIDTIVLDAKTIRRRVQQLGREISRHYRGKELTAVCILTGAFIFMCDLIRYLRVPVVTEFISISRYSRRPKTGEVKILKDLQSDISGRHVLLVEDIVDTGLTLNYLVRNLSVRQPASLAICALLDRPDLRLADIPIRYTGFNVSSEFLIGYGLDFQGKYRNLPFIATMKRGA
ncbi:MAG TPA: hypoxanthine phosphoribosyltransferase [Acidobacteriota bacterium]|nr:hypoxanthine phosphoribosyltransferase [Acidobacteriota bacterium]